MVMWPCTCWPATKCLPLSATPNQPPNSSAWVSAFQTLEGAALIRTLRSMRSVDEVICNLLVAFILHHGKFLCNKLVARLPRFEFQFASNCSRECSEDAVKSLQAPRHKVGVRLHGSEAIAA